MCDDGEVPTFEWTGGEQWRSGGPEHVPLARVHPLALVARALAVVEYLAGEALQTSGEDSWVIMGVTGAVCALVGVQRYDDVGLLLRGLELLVPPEQRAKWPLAGWERPPAQPVAASEHR
jgi:hypothetical protein